MNRHALKERAEDYTAEEMLTFLKRSEGWDLAKFIEFFKSDKPLFNLFGPKGSGKTMLVRAALLQWGGSYTYLPYYTTRKLASLEGLSGLIIVDDIHYIIDDMRAGNLDIDEVVAFLWKVVNYSQTKGKVILVGEDVFTLDYLDEEDSPNIELYKKDIYPCLRQIGFEYDLCNNHPYFVCSVLGVDDKAFREFMSDMNPTARAVTAFVKNVAETWAETRTLMLAELAKEEPYTKTTIFNVAKKMSVRRPTIIYYCPDCEARGTLKVFSQRHYKSTPYIDKKGNAKTFREFTHVSYQCPDNCGWSAPKIPPKAFIPRPSLQDWTDKIKDSLHRIANYQENTANYEDHQIIMAAAKELFSDYLHHHQSYLEYLMKRGREMEELKHGNGI